MSPAAADGPPYLARIRLTADGVPHGGGMLCAGRLVVTAAHVVSPTAEPPWRVFVDFPFVQGRVIAATVLPGGWHPSDDGDRGDIAVLELTEPPPDGVAQAPLLLASALAGHRFRAYGFPAGHPDGVWARGEIEGRAMGEWIQLVADAGKGYLIDRGFSGSPLFDETLGAVVGIVVAKEKDASVRGGFAIAIDVICRRIPLLGPLLGWRVSKDEDFLGYWDPRARGVDQAGRAGDYFTGRRCALETLVNWINTEAKAGLCALTGGLGSGKSALIARLLVLGDPDARDALGTRDADPAVTPPPGWADVGVRASMLRLGELRERLAAGLGLPSVDPDALVSGLAARTAATIVIDAVDEAADDPTTVIRELLVPIARHGGARVLAGIRPGEGGRYLRAFGSAATVIDLDDPAYFSQEDLVEYAARSLRLGGWHGGQSPLLFAA